MPNDICMKLETALSLLRAADACSDKARTDVYRAARSVLQDAGSGLEALIKVKAVGDEEDD